MANTYTQLYFHIVFAVKGREGLISKNWEEQLYKYITAIVTDKSQKMMFVNGMPDHLHLLIGTKPNCNLSDLVRVIKTNSTKWINEKQFVPGKFAWQIGFGAFTVSQSQVPRVIDYIKNQEQHHQKTTFKEEYIEFLNANNIDFDQKYIFD